MSQQPGMEVQGVQVTARNWQDPPGNRWAFWHVDKLLPVHQVSRGEGPARVLPSAAGRDGTAAAQAGLLAVPVTRTGGPGGSGVAGTVGEVLADTFTDAYVVLQDGELVT